MKRLLLTGFGALAGLFFVLQLVPYGRDHTNPAGNVEPAWDSPETRALVQRACFDCHSNQTVWPWYSHVAPVSWLVQRDVDEGRAALNFSAFDQPQEEAEEAAEAVLEGEMPMQAYLITHPEARLTAAERDLLVRGLTATLGGEGGEAGGRADAAEAQGGGRNGNEGNEGNDNDDNDINDNDDNDDNDEAEEG